MGVKAIKELNRNEIIWSFVIKFVLTCIPIKYEALFIILNEFKSKGKAVNWVKTSSYPIIFHKTN